MTRTSLAAAALLICSLPAEIPAQAQTLALAEWQVFLSEDGHFEAMFPDAPKAYTDSQIRNGVTATTRVLAAGTPAFYCDYIDSTFATLLESRNVTILRPPTTELQAVRFTAIADTRRYTSIMAVEGSRFYHVVASSQRFGFSRGDVARCLSGFKLLPNS